MVDLSATKSASASPAAMGHASVRDGEEQRNRRHLAKSCAAAGGGPIPSEQNYGAVGRDREGVREEYRMKSRCGGLDNTHLISYFFQ